MDSSKKPGKSAVESSEEDWSLRKKSGASFSDQKSSGVIRLERRRAARDAELFAESMAELVKSLVADFDASHGVREIRANHRSITGWVAGRNASGPIPFESTLERDFAYLALFEPRVSRLQAQPITLTYRGERGHSRRYTPDFLVEYEVSGVGTRKAIIEIKFSDDLKANRQNLEPGFQAMQAWCDTHDHTFHIVTEVEIRTTRIANVKAVFPFRYDKNADSQVSDAVFEVIRRNAPLSIGGILDHAHDDSEYRAAMQSEIWGLLATGMIWVDLDETLGPQSMIHLIPPADTPLFFIRSDG
ncbi:MAG: TnsA endonuclease N-terminal domain-containing protein [Phyllobacterium sp.]